ncbi:MAG: penicillin-binding protein, partial [Propionibacteriaceae bacterium]|nr:penicillin-binding protein [Propionibacteriaceae bacterium]
MAKRSAKAKPRRRLTRRQKVVKVTLWGAICLVGLMLVGLVAGLIYYELTPIPDPNADFTTSTTTIYYSDGTTVLGRLAVQNRTPLAYDDMPQSMKDAVVAAEDRTFWTNRGISVPGMLRATWNIVRGGDLQSGSTLTQQYVKTLYLTNAQTVTRKVKELVLSVKMTNSMSKEQILAGYLNTVYFGRGTYGIQAAAKSYFNVDAKDLTVPQAAVLTSLLRGPALYDPADADNLPRLLDRYNYVLDSMVATGALTQAEENQYRGQLPDFPKVPFNQTYGGTKGYLLKMVEAELQQVAGLTSAQVAGGGLSITTTFDVNMQAAAVASAQKFTQQAAENARKPQDPSQLHVAIASVNAGTGEVLALYGGPDFLANNLNWATRPRTTGSTFKPFAFIAGERAGASLSTQLNGNTIKVGNDTIHNDGNGQYGTVSLLRATQSSINTAFVDLVQKTPDGPNQVIKAAEDAGLTANSSWQAVPVITLGTAEASPLGMASAYATFDNDGVAVAPHVVAQVKDATGAVIYTVNPTNTQSIEIGIARDLTYALQSVVDAGTGVAAR